MLKKIVTDSANDALGRLKAIKNSLVWEGRWSSDRRQTVTDFRRIRPEDRRPSSPLLQFYSSAKNIGNYLPVFGIHDMLEVLPDMWCIHDKEIDFDLINSRYRGVIIGGAGLLHKKFEHFWRRFSKECNIPAVVWGVGICVPDEDETPGVSRSVVSDALARCDLINVRDDLTANWYDIADAHISPCPTVAYLDRGFVKGPVENGRTLFSMHRRLVAKSEVMEIQRVAGRIEGTVSFTDNNREAWQGVDDVVQRMYCGSKAVVTTRLHGAIIAYALEIPYVAVARDEKLRSFGARYGNGVLIEKIRAIPDALGVSDITRKVDTDSVYAFGGRVRDWHHSLCQRAPERS